MGKFLNADLASAFDMKAPLPCFATILTAQSNDWYLVVVTAGSINELIKPLEGWLKCMIIHISVESFFGTMPTSKQIRLGQGGWSKVPNICFKLTSLNNLSLNRFGKSKAEDKL